MIDDGFSSPVRHSSRAGFESPAATCRAGAVHTLADAAHYMRIPATALVHRTPDGITLEDAAIIDLLARGLVTSRGIVTHGFSLEEWDEAIRVADSLDSIKVLLKPQ